MPIRHLSAAGANLRCDYSPGFVPPEMVKRRPVVVVSPKLPNRSNLCTVVPLSPSPPEHPAPFHLHLLLPAGLPPPYTSTSCWVKADMVATVSLHRLSFFQDGRGHTGARNYLRPTVSAAELRAIRVCIAHALGMSALLSQMDGDT
jgi:uncharacterized protein YifN (PemK superfamily)